MILAYGRFWERYDLMSTCIVGGQANRRSNGNSSREDLWKGHTEWEMVS